MTIYHIGEKSPRLAASCFVAASADVIGELSAGENCSLWFGAKIRADNEPITLGAGTNVQEGAVLHTDPGFPMTIGERVTIGHQAMLHGCSIGEGSLIGIQAVVMNGAVIGRQCLVGAGAVVTERKQFADRSLILGAPAKAVRTLDDAEVARLAEAAEVYIRKAAQYREQLQPATGRDEQHR